MDWLDKLKARMSRSREPQAPGETPHAHVAWIEAEQSRFGVRVLDCREFCHTMVSMTADPKLAFRFAELRLSTGEEHRGKMPAHAMCVASLLTYPLTGKPGEGVLFRASEMEDKWDIYYLNGWFYFARSWGGEIVFRAEVKFTGTQAIVSMVEADAKLSADPQLAVRQVDFLIKNHLLGMEVAHPLPAGFPDDPMQIAVYSHNWYGRHAAFAAYEDTTLFGRKFDPDETLR